MASTTLAESAKLSQDMLISGVIENVITVNPIFEVMPFTEIEGNALAYNRENVLGAVEATGVGTTITTGKAAATWTQVTSSLTTLVGDAEVNGLIQATRSNINDQRATQVASKAKSLSREYQNQLINGSGSSNEFYGLLSLLDAGQTVTAGANGAALTFDMLDEVIDLVTDKDSQCDYMMMNGRTLRSLKALLRGLGGAAIDHTLQLPSGRTVLQYSGIPIFRNDWIPINQTQGSETAATTVLAGTFDDGSRSHGFSGLTAMGEAGIRVEDPFTSETKDETITRVKWYCGLALFSLKGLAGIVGVNN